jgi:hypothetical protein
MSTRRHAISRICAVWLMTLIILPFTAPFASYDLAHPGNHSSHDGLVKEKTASDKEVVAPPRLIVGPPALTVLAMAPTFPDSRYAERPLLFAVLRV